MESQDLTWIQALPFSNKIVLIRFFHILFCVLPLNSRISGRILKVHGSGEIPHNLYFGSSKISGVVAPFGSQHSAYFCDFSSHFRDILMWKEKYKITCYLFHSFTFLHCHDPKLNMQKWKQKKNICGGALYAYMWRRNILGQKSP